jgi:hypothetical protein
MFCVNGINMHQCNFLFDFAKVNALPARALRRFQSASGEELSALMPSILDQAFKGEL